MNYFYSPFSKDIQHVYASELPLPEISFCLSVSGIARTLLSYEPPSSPIFMMGTLSRMINGQYLAVRCMNLGRLESWSVDDCENFLEQDPTVEAQVDLSPRNRKKNNTNP